MLASYSIDSRMTIRTLAAWLGMLTLMMCGAASTSQAQPEAVVMANWQWQHDQLWRYEDRQPVARLAGLAFVQRDLAERVAGELVAGVPLAPVREAQGRAADSYGVAYRLAPERQVQDWLESGLAVVTPNPDLALDWPKWRQWERRAELAQRGIWAKDRPWLLPDATQVTAAATYMAGGTRFMLWRGTPTDSGKAQDGTAFLNFGDDWKTDATAVLQPHDKRRYFKRGYKLEPLIGQPVELRGWVRNYNGPSLIWQAQQQLTIVAE